MKQSDNNKQNISTKSKMNFQDFNYGDLIILKEVHAF